MADAAISLFPKRCKKCGGTDFKSNGTCRACANEQQRARKAKCREQGRKTPCQRCGGTDFYKSGDCRPCTLAARRTKAERLRQTGCPKCGGFEFNQSGDCRSCKSAEDKAYKDHLRQQTRTEPCEKCGGTEFTAIGKCFSCEQEQRRQRRARYHAEGRKTSCRKCGGTDFYPGGDCKTCAAENRQNRIDRWGGVCPRCGGTEFNSSNDCRRCLSERIQARTLKMQTEGRQTPCEACGGMDFFPSGNCRTCAERRREERKSDPEKLVAYREWNAEWARERRKHEKWRVHGRVSSLVGQSLKQYNAAGKARSSWTRILGYTVEQLVAHLKKTLPKGWTWQDYLDGKMHIDHIIPVKAFNFNSPHCEDFKRCWALSNLRLLPEKENLSKGAKVVGLL